MKYILLLSALLLAGCVRPVPTTAIEQSAQSSADAIAAAEYILDIAMGLDEITFAASAIQEHVDNAQKAIGTDELPKPRVTVREWKTDYRRAREDTSHNLERDSYNLAQIGAAVAVGTMMIGIGTKLATVLAKSHPIGQLIGGIGMLFGQESPTKRIVHNKILCTLEEYKEIDPEWRTNKLYVLLSDKLTTSEKDYIKRQRDELL